jgi:hypothetical protein
MSLEVSGRIKSVNYGNYRYSGFLFRGGGQNQNRDPSSESKECGWGGCVCVCYSHPVRYTVGIWVYI